MQKVVIVLTGKSADQNYLFFLRWIVWYLASIDTEDHGSIYTGSCFMDVNI